MDNTDNHSESTQNDLGESLNQGSPKSTLPPKKNKKKRIIIWSFIVVLLLIAGVYAYRVINPDSTGPRINPLDFIPANAQVIIETDKPYKLWSQLSQTNIWKILERDKEWAQYGRMLVDIENSLSNFDRALDLLGHRKVYISQHQTYREQSDLLYIADLEALGLIQTWMVNLSDVTKRKYGEHTIYEKIDKVSKDSFSFTFVDSYLVTSYTHSLVEQAIDEINNPTLSRNPDFISMRKEVYDEGLLRIYTNYEETYQSFLSTEEGKEFEEYLEYFPLNFGGYYFDINENSFLLQGATNYNIDSSSYLKLFKPGQEGTLDIATFAPNSTSVFFSIGFDSFSSFYENFLTSLTSDPEANEAYWYYAKKTQKFLNFDIEEDIVSWIDDEMALLQIETDGRSESAFVLKGKNQSQVNEKMAFLSRQIKRRSPVKFKTIPYQNYEIKYMAVKGLFKLVLGKLFTKVERPFYTIIDEYVIFGSSPEALMSVIDHVRDNTTLSDELAYQEFISKLGEKHNLLTYIQLDLLKKSKDGMIDKSLIDYINEKSNILKHTPQFGFRVSAKKGYYKTSIMASIESTDVVPSSPVAVPDSLQLFKNNPFFSSEHLNLSEVEVEDLEAENQSELFEDGNPKYDYQTKNGKKHGAFYEFYPNGDIKIIGKYKNDLKEGTWKHYDENGKLIEKVKYRKGQLN
ncbi:DUF3352 domain-containing protein [Reichenbachiella versicolor]|uniref:DUF3352 domain-containing protein n=1 Tax=Reichenbachiella versicolor TaxID=1821036 RepID=UPI000D6EAC6E|nr:DUF3352 domain-containing protein [Reichenbachiella versicolor]